MASEPQDQYWMQLNTIKQDGYAVFREEYDETSVGEGRAKKTIWTAKVIAAEVFGELAKAIPSGTSFEAKDTRKPLARDAASKQMVSLFRSRGVKPKVGKGNQAQR